MTVHVKMLLKDGVSFRLLTAVDPVNIQVIASDPDLDGVPVLTVSNPPSKHIIANDAWIMNEKGDTISKIDFKALTKVGTPEPIKPIIYAEKTVDVIAGTPIFKPEKMEEQHRGAEFGAFIGMDFYPFYCIAPSLVREYGVYASDEIIEQLRKTKLVSYVFLALLKENAEKYNPEVRVIHVGGESSLVNKTVLFGPEDSHKLFAETLSPESLQKLQKELIQNTDIVLVIVYSPAPIDNLMPSVLVISKTLNKHRCVTHYTGGVTEQDDFTLEELQTYSNCDAYTIFTVTRDEIFTVLTRERLKNEEHLGNLRGDYFQTALARKRFYEVNPEFKDRLSTAEISVLGMVDFMKSSSLTIATGTDSVVTEPQAITPEPNTNTDPMKQALLDKLDNIPVDITACLNKDDLTTFKEFVVDHVKGLLRADVWVTTILSAGSYSNTVKIFTGQHMMLFTPVVTPVADGALYPAQRQDIWNVYQSEGKYGFDWVEEN